MNILSKVLMVAALIAAPACAQVVINECDATVPDWCEITNLGNSAVNIGGWQLVMSDDPNTTTLFTFPAGTSIAPGEFIVVSEVATGPAVPAGTQVFVTAANINWSQAGAGACGLNDNTGAGVDLVNFGSPTNTPAQTPVSPFAGTLPFSDVYARRTLNDTDTSLDWATVPAANGTPGAPNSGQTPGTLIPLFAALNPVIGVGDTVVFADQSIGVATSWDWDLDGDGTIDATGPGASFTYNTAGTYDVTLTVSNASGSNSLTQTAYVNVQGSSTSSIPYAQDFTSPLGIEWLTSITGPGSITQIPDNAPLSGGNALAFQSTVQSSFATCTATLTLDVAATGGGILRYYAREAGDEPHPEDGVFLSDGVTTVKVVDHATLSGTWQEITVDLTQEINTSALTLSPNFQIIFSWRDNFPIPTDGLLIDDVRVTPPPVPDVGQANGMLAYLNVNDGLNVNGNPAFMGENGPFFASGNAFDITVRGNANQPFLLLLGPLNRNNLVFPFGSLDLGSSAALADVSIIMNGAAPATLFDTLAFVGAAGESALNFDAAALPLGVLGSFQVMTLTGDPANPYALSAAFEFTVTP